MAAGSRTGGWKKNAIVTGVVLSPIAVLALLFWLLASAYQAELDRGGQPDQPRALP
ncbi:MAG: hypothetical protein ACIAQU_04975 [Phycisphaerales bacterium JB064]